MTQEEEQKVLALYRAGKSDCEIGRQVGYHPCTIGYFRKKRNLPVNAAAKGRTKGTPKRVPGGDTKEQIQRCLHCSRLDCSGNC